MSILYPAVMTSRVTDIKPETVKGFGLKALILDVDNTLTTHNNPVLDEDVRLWIDMMRQSGIKLIIASNNKSSRIKPFAANLGLGYAAYSFKPLPVGFLRVSRRLGLRPRSFGVVGDQIFTDILGGNLFGAKTFLVTPMKLETGWGFKIKRRLETVILKKYLDKNPINEGKESAQ